MSDEDLADIMRLIEKNDNDLSREEIRRKHELNAEDISMATKRYRWLTDFGRLKDE